MGWFGFFLIFSTVKAVSNKISRIKNPTTVNSLVPFTKNKFNTVVYIPRQCRLKEYPNIIYKNPCRCEDKCKEIDYK